MRRDHAWREQWLKLLTESQIRPWTHSLNTYQPDWLCAAAEYSMIICHIPKCCKSRFFQVVHKNNDVHKANLIYIRPIGAENATTSGSTQPSAPTESAGEPPLLTGLENPSQTAPQPSWVQIAHLHPCSGRRSFRLLRQSPAMPVEVESRALASAGDSLNRLVTAL